MKHILYNNYFSDNDEQGKDAYDYAREQLWERYEEYRFEDNDYYSDQLQIPGLESYTCPICGEDYLSLAEAKECCRDEKWETADDIPDDMVTQEVYANDELNFDDFKVEFGHYIKGTTNGLLLCGSIGRWDGRARGGYVVTTFDDLYKFWDGCDYIKVYDEKGHLHIEATHHDGTNYCELKEITGKGSEFLNQRVYDSDEETHGIMFDSNFYTRLPHYAHKQWGCKKGV